MLEDQLKELESLVKKQEKDIKEKCALLTASKKAVREYKEKIRVRLLYDDNLLIFLVPRVLL